MFRSQTAVRQLCFSVSIHDCKVDHFTCGGKGGSGKDTSNNGARVTHEPSGAVGEARDSRSQPQNTRAAFRRMAQTKEFQAWARLRVAALSGTKSVDQLVDEAMAPHNLRVERRGTSGWEPFE
jgi:protein subunit release factor A